MIRRPAHVPDVMRSEALERLLWPQLAGTPADGSEGATGAPSSVVWVDRGDEVVVHGDSLRVRIGAGALVVAIDLETDQTGRQTLVLPMAVGTSAEQRLTVVVEELPRGDATLARRWGPILSAALFSALEAIVAAHAAASGGVPKALYVEGAELRLRSVVPP